MVRNLRVGLEVRPPVVVKKKHPRKREGESGATAAFLLSKHLGKQSNDGQPNRPSAPESHRLFSPVSGLKMGTSLSGIRQILLPLRLEIIALINKCIENAVKDESSDIENLRSLMKYVETSL